MAEIRIQQKERHAWPWLLMALLLAAIVWLVVRSSDDRVGMAPRPAAETVLAMTTPAADLRAA